MKTVDFVARCLISAIKKQISNVSIKIITKEEYDSITPDENTVYYVVDGEKIIQYIGDIKLVTGTASGNLTFTLNSNNNYIVGNLQKGGE